MSVIIDPDPFVVRVLVVALCSALSVIAAMIAGFLVWRAGAAADDVALTSGGAFAGAQLLTLTMASVLRRGL